MERLVGKGPKVISEALMLRRFTDARKKFLPDRTYDTGAVISNQIR
jgi:hypothetical protein